MRDVTAVLLCGGKGKRLRPFTDSLPKPLVSLNGKSLLEYLLRYLEGAGISKFVLCIGYKAECVREFVQSYETNSEIVCVDSGDASMTDRILDARKHVEGRALICYGDTLANVDLPELFDLHQLREADATLTLYPMRSPYGIVEACVDGQVSSFLEKPLLPHWINIGFILCEPVALNQIRPNSNLPDFLNGLQSGGRLFAYRHLGRHITVNTEKERQTAESEVGEFCK